MRGTFSKVMVVVVALSACTLSDLQKAAQEFFEVSTNPPTAGDPNAPLKIDGVRLAEDFSVTGKLFVHFSVIPDRADLTDKINPTRVTLSLSEPAGATASVRVTRNKLNKPVDVAVDIDSSGSMKGADPDRLRVKAAKGLIMALRDIDRFAVMDFGAGNSESFRKSRLLSKLTSDKSVADAALKEVTDTGSTPLLDSAVDAIGYLAKGDSERQRAVVILTDGYENGSANKVADVARHAKTENVNLIVLAFAGYREKELQELASKTGGLFNGNKENKQLEAQFSGAARAVYGDAIAEIEFPSPNREAKRFSGSLKTTIEGTDYSGTFNVSR